MINWKEVFKDAKWFHWSGIAAALSQSSADTCKEAIEVANSMGLTISCDLNFRQNLWNYGKMATEVMPALVQYSDVIFGSEPEYEKIFGIAPVGFKAITVNEQLNIEGFELVGKRVLAEVPRCKKMFLELRNSINSNHNTLAGIVYSDQSLKYSRIYDITHAVDRVGVGDAFVGGMIYGLIAYPDNDQKALDFALAASCLKNTIYGDFNLVTVAEVENLMEGDGSGRVVR